MGRNNGGDASPHPVEVKIEYTVTLETGDSHRFHMIHTIVKPDTPHAMLEKMTMHKGITAGHESCLKMVANLVDIMANGDNDGNPLLVALEERNFG